MMPSAALMRHGRVAGADAELAPVGTTTCVRMRDESRAGDSAWASGGRVGTFRGKLRWRYASAPATQPESMAPAIDQGRAFRGTKTLPPPPASS
jgi:hypothetical protein